MLSLSVLFMVEKKRLFKLINFKLYISFKNVSFNLNDFYLDAMALNVNKKNTRFLDWLQVYL